MKLVVSNSQMGLFLKPDQLQKIAERKGIKVFYYGLKDYGIFQKDFENFGWYRVNDVLLLKDYGDIVNVNDIKNEDYFNEYSLDKTDKDLIAFIEEKRLTNIEIVEIPDNSHYIVIENEGYEEVYYSASEIIKVGEGQ